MSEYPPPGKPLSVARQFLREHYTHVQKLTGGLERETETLGHHRGHWYWWRGTHWETTQGIEQRLRLDLYQTLEAATYTTVKDGEPEQTEWTPTANKVSGVIDPLKSLAYGNLPDEMNAPFWLQQYDNQEPATQYVAMDNGLLHLPTRRLEDHTPELFTTWALPFGYDADATCPNWDRFLTGIFEHDRNGALLLQEFAGYLISGRMEQHKGLLIVGPPRSGKGTISRILKQLVGVDNTASPSLHSLGSDFGLEPLIGKPFAVIEDARGDDDRRNNRTVEVLLNIIGQDQVSVNRKGIDYWNGTLPTRFMLVSNETPRFLDASGAITSRFMAVELQTSFRGREDTDLGERLARELPGIFNWALAGLARLDNQGSFTQADTHEEVKALMDDLAAPVAAFIRETYDITGIPNDWVPVTGPGGMLDEFRRYREQMGNKPMSLDEFFRRLRASGLEGVQAKNSVPSCEQKKMRHVTGVVPKPVGFTAVGAVA